MPTDADYRYVRELLERIDALEKEHDRVTDLRAWAESRIRQCREQEQKFAGAWEHREKHSLGPPQALVEAWSERRTLQAVLGMVSPQARKEGD